VILSDGGDNRSRATVAQVKSAVMESDVLVYAMGIFDEGKGTREEQNGPKLLDEITARSGGKHFRARTVDDLPAISAQIGEELRSQYVLGYAPGNLETDGRYHHVKVELVPPPDMPRLRVHYRPGYFAPAR
jgi:Ca-activated chloride channel homolog